MISFLNNRNEEPFIIFRSTYKEAKKANQRSIEAMCISSYSKTKKTIDSRYVNLKFVDDAEFIFFTNYNSTKSQQFMEHKQVSLNIFWPKISSQIRIKGNINKKSHQYNQAYFNQRIAEKNALAISSSQSRPIGSFEDVKLKYLSTLKNSDLKKCPDYWGGFAIIPYEFEFWVGHEYRLNERTHYNLVNGAWQKTLLQP